MSSISVVKLAKHITEMQSEQDKLFVEYFSAECEVNIHQLSLDLLQSIQGVQMSVLATIEEISHADENTIADILKLDREQITKTLEELVRLNLITRTGHSWTKNSNSTFENRNFFNSL